MAHPAAGSARIATVSDLVSLTISVSAAKETLALYPFDYVGEPFQIRASHLHYALTKCLDGELSATELHDWAELLEFRDDVVSGGALDEEKAAIFDAIFALANPTLNPGTVTETAKFLQSELGRFL